MLLLLHGLRQPPCRRCRKSLPKLPSSHSLSLALALHLHARQQPPILGKVCQQLCSSPTAAGCWLLAAALLSHWLHFAKGCESLQSGAACQPSICRLLVSSTVYTPYGYPIANWRLPSVSNELLSERTSRAAAVTTPPAKAKAIGFDNS